MSICSKTYNTKELLTGRHWTAFFLCRATNLSRLSISRHLKKAQPTGFTCASKFSSRGTAYLNHSQQTGVGQGYSRIVSAGRDVNLGPKGMKCAPPYVNLRARTARAHCPRSTPLPRVGPLRRGQEGNMSDSPVLRYRSLLQLVDLLPILQSPRERICL